MTYRPSAERTRSRRWRSGTRSNKRHPVASIPLCPRPTKCLVHTSEIDVALAARLSVVFWRKPASGLLGAMAMRLTRCEQKWVDDVRAGRDHLHVRYTPQTKRERRYFAVTLLRKKINTERMRVRGIINESSSPSGRIMSSETQFIQVYAAAARKMDISDRWYPRGS